MDVQVGAQVVTADGRTLGMVERREQDYFEVLPEDGSEAYWLNFDAIAGGGDGEASEHEVRVGFAADELERYQVRPASTQRALAEDEDELSTGPVGRMTVAGGADAADFSGDLASDVAARRGTPAENATPERREGPLRERERREGET
jgi:hypothetical protein